MAPEQCDPGALTPAADIYALGLIMYEMLTGQRPFDKGATPQATVLLRKEVPPRPLRELLPRLDRAWEIAVAAAWNPSPAVDSAHARDVIASLAGARATRRSVDAWPLRRSTFRRPAPRANADRTKGLHLTVMGPNLFETYPLPSRDRIDIGARRRRRRPHRRRAGLAPARPPPLDLREDLRRGSRQPQRHVRQGRADRDRGKQVALQPGEAITIGFTHLMVQRQRPRHRAPAAQPRRLRGAPGRRVRARRPRAGRRPGR